MIEIARGVGDSGGQLLQRPVLGDPHPAGRVAEDLGDGVGVEVTEHPEKDDIRLVLRERADDQIGGGLGVIA